VPTTLPGSYIHSEAVTADGYHSYPIVGRANFDAVVNVEMLHYPRAISEKGDLLIPGRGLMMVGRMRHLKSGAVASPHVRDDISTNNMVL